jgi:hypothetical protein
MEQHPEVFVLLGLAMGLMMIFGAIGGVFRGKFMLGNPKLTSKTCAITREQKPVLFWLFAAAMTGLGGLCLWAAFGLQP